MTTCVGCNIAVGGKGGIERLLFLVPPPFSRPRMGAPAMVRSDEIDRAVTACSSDSKVTYHVFPTSGRRDLGLIVSDENASITSTSVAESGMSRRINVLRSLLSDGGNG